MKIKLTIPIMEDEIRKLRVGDQVELTGIMVTARDNGHKLMVEEAPDFIRPYLRDGVIYHCGPVVKKNDVGEWEFVAAGPTTSSREEPYQATVIGEYQVRGVIGKGGMKGKTMAGLKTHGAVYFHAVGGLGSLLAQRVTRVKEVFKLEEFGTPEAFWVIEVKDFPVVVTMDSHGGSLHEQVLESSDTVVRSLLAD
jgi:fumarate hydratase class I